MWWWILANAILRKKMSMQIFIIVSNIRLLTSKLKNYLPKRLTQFTTLLSWKFDKAVKRNDYSWNVGINRVSNYGVHVQGPKKMILKYRMATLEINDPVPNGIHYRFHSDQCFKTDCQDSRLSASLSKGKKSPTTTRFYYGENAKVLIPSSFNMIQIKAAKYGVSLCLLKYYSIVYWTTYGTNHTTLSENTKLDTLYSRGNLRQSWWGVNAFRYQKLKGKVAIFCFHELCICKKYFET